MHSAVAQLAHISGGSFLVQMDTNPPSPRYPLSLRLSRGSPTRLDLLPANAMQLPPELLCRVPAQVHACLQQWWLTGYRQAGVDKDLRVPGPALLVPVEPLGFFGGWILDEALTSHD